LERHKESDAVLAVFEPTLVPAAERYVALYEEDRLLTTSQRGSSRERDALVTRLRDRTLAWMAALERDIPYFQPTDYASRPDMADEVFDAARGVLTAVADHASRGTASRVPTPLPYAETLSAELSGLLVQTQQQATGVDGSLVEQQGLTGDLREAAVELHRQLRLFRRAVKRVLGATHRDYLRLKIRSLRDVDVEEEDDDIAIDQQPTVLLNGSGAPSEEARH